MELAFVCEDVLVRKSSVAPRSKETQAFVQSYTIPGDRGVLVVYPRIDRARELDWELWTIPHGADAPLTRTLHELPWGADEIGLSLPEARRAVALVDSLRQAWQGAANRGEVLALLEVANPPALSR